MKGKDVFKAKSKANAFNNSYHRSLSGIGGIRELISTKYLVSNKITAETQSSTIIALNII